MEKKPPPWTLGELADLLKGALHGPADLLIERPVPSGSDDPHGIAFAEDRKYLAQIEASGVAAGLIAPDQTLAKPFIAVESPRAAFGALLVLAAKSPPLSPGAHPTAVVSAEAVVDATASIGPYAVVERGAWIGARSRIFPFCYIGQDCRIGEDCTIYPHAVLYQDVRVGAGSTIHAGAILGADGFGYAWDGSTRVKIPQVGGVALGDFVEIGALTAIDRATAGDTVVSEGTKIDNLVQIGHNVQIGKHAVLAAKTGVGGSTRIGDRVVAGGNVDFSDHVTVCDDVTLAGRAGVPQDIAEPGVYMGFPPKPMVEARRILMVGAKLPELLARIRRLESIIQKKPKL